MAMEREEELKNYLELDDFKAETYVNLSVEDLLILKNTSIRVRLNAKEPETKKFYSDKEKFFIYMLLNKPDFNPASYNACTLSDVIILHGSAQGSKAKIDDEQAKEYFTRREVFFMGLVIRKFIQSKQFFCVFNGTTKVPYIHCDEETMNDQVWVYTDEKFAELEIIKKKLEDTKLNLMFVKVEQKDINGFIMSLFNSGVNEIVIDGGLISMNIDLHTYFKAPDYSNLPEEQRPVFNPGLLLTATYLSQEIAIPEDDRDMEKIMDLQEEMLANIERGKIIVPTILPEGVENPQPKDRRILVLKLQNGDPIQPIFTDIMEFSRFKKDGKVEPIVIDGVNLGKIMPKEVDKLILNPNSLNLILMRQML